MRKIMLYMEYEEYKRKYQEAQSQYNDILSEKEKLFQITQPQGINTEHEKVSGGSPKNAFDQYLILKEQNMVDERLDEIKTVLADRERLLKQKETDLRSSKDLYDRIYVLRYLDRVRVFKIARKMGYSESQVYRILNRIEKKTCEKMRK